jgi:hypothetical protein
MTDRLAALELLADEDSPARSAALQHFHDTYHDQPLAMLKWLYVQVCGGLRRADGCSHCCSVFGGSAQSCLRGQHKHGVRVLQPSVSLVSPCVSSLCTGCE